jgi:branched-chain amino acid transport system permease protein
MGIAENGAAYLLGGIWKDAVSFIILIIVLVIRPTGLFGGKEE